MYANSDKCKNSGCRIGFDSCSEFSIGQWKHVKNFVIFGADMNSSMHIDNKNKDILILDEGPTQRLADITSTAEAKYPINFTQLGKRFVLSLHYNGSNSFLFVNATKTYQFKTKDSEINDYALFLGDISKDLLQLII